MQEQGSSPDVQDDEWMELGTGVHTVDLYGKAGHPVSPDSIEALEVTVLNELSRAQREVCHLSQLMSKMANSRKVKGGC